MPSPGKGLPDQIVRVGVRKDILEAMERANALPLVLSVFKVTSGNSGNIYFVQVWKIAEGPFGSACSCPDGIFRIPVTSGQNYRKCCKHVLRVLERMERNEL